MAKGDRENLKADIDDGYAKVANLLLEALACAPLTTTEFRLVVFVMRRTYSWARKDRPGSATFDVMTAADMAAGTGAPLRTVERALGALLKERVLLRVPIEGGIAGRSAYGINPLVADWGSGPAWLDAKVAMRHAQQVGATTQSCVPVRSGAYPQYAIPRTDGTQSCVPEQALSPAASGSDEAPTESLKTENIKTDKEEGSQLVAPQPPANGQVEPLTNAELRRQERAELLQTREGLLVAIPQGDAELVRGFIANMADENGSGRVTLPREVSEIRALIALREELGAQPWAYGVFQANAARAPNVNYVKKAAANYRPGQTRTGPQSTTTPTHRSKFGSGRV